MFYKYVVLLLMASSIALLPEESNVDHIWTTDKNEVFVGGCITIVINQPSRLAHEYFLVVDDGPPVRLVDKMGPTLRLGKRTMVLLSHQLFSEDGYEFDNVNPKLVHMVPLFNRPGTVHLTLLYGNDSLGTKVITVKETTNRIETAIEPLFPMIDHEHRKSMPDSLLLQVLMGTASTRIKNEPDAVIHQLYRELEIIKNHPDWEEIASMVVSNTEATIHYKNIISTYRKAHANGNEISPEPTIPLSISHSLKRKLDNPFARAIQDGINKKIAARHWIPTLNDLNAQGQHQH